MGVLRPACDGLAGALQSPAVVGHRYDRIVGWTCGDQYHHAPARLPPVEAARGSCLEMGVPAENSAGDASPGAKSRCQGARQLILSKPSVSSIETPQGSMIVAVAMLFMAASLFL